MNKRVIATLAILTALVPMAVYAAAPAPAKQGGITISPVIEQLQLGPGQDSADFTVSVTNHTDLPVRISLGFNDFKALNNSGGIAFLGQNASDFDKNHGLTRWVQIGIEQLGLEPNQSVNVPVHLKDLQSLPPGGHYGAIIYQVVPGGVNPNGNKVFLNPTLSSLVFVVTAGGGTQKLSLAAPAAGGTHYNIPDSVSLNFKNTGNAQTAPRGSVTVYHHNSQQPVATAIINTSSALVLPGTARRLETPLTVVAKPLWPGKYHLKVMYRPDNATSFQTATVDFFYINPLGALLVALITVLSAALLYPVKRYNRHLQRVANSRRWSVRLARFIYRVKIELIRLGRDVKRLLRRITKH